MAGFIRISELPAASSLLGDELVEVSQVSTTITITGTDISAQASDNSYNHAGSGFVSAGFAVGDRVRVTGFTGNVANNIVTGRITALTTSKMTIGGTDGDVIVDDAAGESVTISKWTTKRALLSDIGIGGGGGSSSYHIRVAFKIIPTSNQILDTIPLPEEVTFPANFSGSLGIIGVNPTATFVIDVKDDGTTIGTISISTSGVFTFATVSGTDKVVSAGSILTFVAPTTVDATANNLSAVVVGSL